VLLLRLLRRWFALGMLRWASCRFRSGLRFSGWPARSLPSFRMSLRCRSCLCRRSRFLLLSRCWLVRHGPVSLGPRLRSRSCFRFCLWPCSRSSFWLRFRSRCRPRFCFGLRRSRRSRFPRSYWTNCRCRTNALVRSKRPLSHEYRRFAMIDRGKLGAIGSRRPRELHLRLHRRRVRCAEGRNFSRTGTNLDPLWAAVEAHTVVHNRPVDDDSAVVDVGNVHAAKVIDSAVVGEVITMPVAALVANSHIAESIIHAAVKADIAAPIAVIEAVASTDETPISRRPQSALIRRLSPCSGNPVIAG